MHNIIHKHLFEGIFYHLTKMSNFVIHIYSGLEITSSRKIAGVGFLSMTRIFTFYTPRRKNN